MAPRIITVKENRPNDLEAETIRLRMQQNLGLASAHLFTSPWICSTFILSKGNHLKFAQGASHVGLLLKDRKGSQGRQFEFQDDGGYPFLPTANHREWLKALLITTICMNTPVESGNQPPN